MIIVRLIYYYKMEAAMPVLMDLGLFLNLLVYINKISLNRLN